MVSIIISCFLCSVRGDSKFVICLFCLSYISTSHLSLTVNLCLMPLTVGLVTFIIAVVAASGLPLFLMWFSGIGCFARGPCARGKKGNDGSVGDAESQTLEGVYISSI